MRAGKLNRRIAFYRLSPALTKTLQDTVWASVRVKALDHLAPAPQGLRNTAGAALTEIRVRYRAGFQGGDYAVHGSQLWHVIHFRDPDGKSAELIASAHELIGLPATYTPAGGAAVTTRAWLDASAPFVPGARMVNEYRLRAEVPIFEVGRPARGDALTVSGRAYQVVGLVDDGDDGVARSLWVTPA